MMRALIIIISMLWVPSVFAQEEINQFFAFEDGIYLSHEALIKNAPDIRLENRESGIYNNPLKILRVNPQDFGLSGDQEIQFVVDQGLPYYRSTRCCPDHTIYVGLTIVGRLSVLSFQSEEMVDVPMKAYNPFNGKPFMQGTVKRERSVKVHRVLDLTTGLSYDMNDAALKELLGITKDQQYLDELIDSVVEYNRANQLYIK